MKALVDLEAIATAAEQRGFEVRRSVHYAHGRGFDVNVTGCIKITPPDATYHEYFRDYHGHVRESRDTIQISDDCNIGYGYNAFFYGPFHPGMCRADHSGLERLYNHPLWTA